MPSSMLLAICDGSTGSPSRSHSSLNSSRSSACSMLSNDGTQNLDLALLQHALLGQLYGQIQARLAAQPRHDGIGTLVTDDLGHVFERQRLHIDLVGDMRVGHDRRGIGIHQDHLVPLLFQREAGLRPRIVELGGLTDHDRPRADHHYFLDIRSLRHFLLYPPSLLVNLSNK